MKTIRRFINDEEGAAMVEYGLLVGLIAAVAVGMVTTLGTTVRDKFSDIINAI